MQIKINARTGPDVELQAPLEPAREPMPLAITTGPAQMQFWKPFDLGRYEADAEWLSKIQSLSGKIENLADLMSDELDDRSWLNVFLLSAGMGQIIEDHLHSDPFLLGRAARFFAKTVTGSGHKAAALALTLAQAWSTINAIVPGTRQMIERNEHQAAYTGKVAALVMSGSALGEDTSDRLVSEGKMLIEATSELPAALLKEVNRLPSCFRSFDQRLEDIHAIAEEFSARRPDKTRAIGVVGVRTSGSFLAPLYQAALKTLGYSDVAWITLRPGTPLLANERSFIRQLARKNGLVLICDDPPNSGETLFKVVNMLRQRGIAQENIVLLLQLFEGSQELPAALRNLQNVTIPWPDWWIQSALGADAVQKELANLLQPELRITHLERLALPYDPILRRHAKALYRMDLVNSVTGRTYSKTIEIKGVGLGYFGEHHLAISRKLIGYSLHIILLKNGLVYEEVPDGLKAVMPEDIRRDEDLLKRMTDYVLKRNVQLTCDVDLSLQLKSRNAVWEVAGNLLSVAFGKAWYLLRMPLLDAQVKRILDVPHPSVIDGDMNLNHWFIRDGGSISDEVLIKENLAERDFSHEDLSTFDAAYDLAALALAVGVEDRFPFMRRYYRDRTGDDISEERWMLHQLVRIWDMRRHNIYSVDQTRAKMTQVLERYYSALYFSESEIRGDGAFCVLDIDGVLETNQLGFASLTSSSAMSLHALEAHGYRVLAASGRSLPEVRDRCKAYHLAGGIAEYGSALYDNSTGREVSLLVQNELDTLEQLRTCLASIAGVSIDIAFKNSVRAFRLDKDGNRLGLDPQSVKVLLEEAGIAHLVVTVPGNAQTDFVVSRIDKGVGIKAWMTMFGGSPALDARGSEKSSITFAVGDTLSDIPMLALAEMAFAPAHTRRVLGQAGIAITKRPYQKGFEEAVTRLLGHAPGECSICQISDFSPESKYMQDVLSVQEEGNGGMIRRSLELLLKQRRYSHVGTN